ncbi:MAG: TolC family protein, partial [Myxococcales bacterium]
MAGEPLEEIAGTRRVCAGGPGEAVARAQRARGEAGVVASQVLPNPSLRAEHQGTLSNVSNGEETILGVSVLLPIGGRRSLHKEAAQARREKALAEARATLFESALAFREAYAVAATDQAKVEVLAEQQQALERL